MESKAEPTHAPLATSLNDARLSDSLRSLSRQVGGTHYSDLNIQPVEYIHRNNIGFIEGNIIKYITRWRNKNGIEDLKKAKHFLDILIEMES